MSNDDSKKKRRGLLSERGLVEVLAAADPQHQFNQMTIRHIGVLIGAVQMLMKTTAKIAERHDKLAKAQGNTQALSRGVAKRVSQIERKIRWSEREFNELAAALRREGIGVDLWETPGTRP